MGNATASQIEPLAAGLLGIFAAAALLAVAIAAARHFLRKGEDASAPSGAANRIAHVAGYVFAAALIAAGGTSLAGLAKGAGGEAGIQQAGSLVGSSSRNPFAPTESSGLEPIAGERSELGKVASVVVEHYDELVAAGKREEARRELLEGIEASAPEGAEAVAIDDDAVAKRLLSGPDYIRYRSGVRFEAARAEDGSLAIRAVG